MRKILFVCACMALVGAGHAQPAAYEEAANPVAARPALWERMTRPQVGWGSTDVRYNKEEPAAVRPQQKSLSLSAWRGERVAAQWVLSTPCALDSLTVEVSDLKSGAAVIESRHIRRGFVRYVMTDELNKDGLGACGYRKSTDFDSTLVADPIDHRAHALSLPPRTTRPGWLAIQVPRDAKAGRYTGTVRVSDGGRTLQTLTLTLHVADRSLPAPSEWAFHLDLWQNPYAAARYYGVEPFGDEHFERMRPDMEHYARAGGKVITASIMHKPWNGQTYDPFESMVTWMKKADGSWMFDYTVFDRWVEFMMSTGVTKQINCYSMVPWRLSFQYFDQASNSFRYLQAKPGEPAYDEFWGRMLTSFARHLKEKGWFEITHIAMDERPMEDMLATLEVIRKADKDFKVSLAGAYHAELAGELDDYCTPIGEKFPEEQLEARRKAGKVTTYYTSCAEPRPNTFTFSEPAEAEWLGWYAARAGLDGYLRWALNSWVKNPLQDSRFTTWAAGDTYLIYPDGRSSIRFERLLQGIQAYEKIRLLREEFTREGNRSGLKKLDAILQEFDDRKLADTPAAVTVSKARAALDRL